MEDVQQGAAVIAAPLLPAERFGPAGDDVGDGATMRWQHRRAVSRQIAAPETAENVRHFGHASEAAHHLVEQLAQRHPRRFRQMRVNRRRGDVLVAERTRAIMRTFYVIETEGSAEQDSMLAGGATLSAR